MAKTKAGPIAADRLKSFIERIEELARREAAINAEISQARADIGDVFEFGPSHTYMMRDRDLVKIGRSVNVNKRRRAVERDSATALSVLRSFPFDCEVHLHHYFAPQWRHGEWFDFHADMLRDDLVVLAVIGREEASQDGLPRAARFLPRVQTEVALLLEECGGLPKIKTIVEKMGCSLGKAHKLRKLVRQMHRAQTEAA